MRLLPQPSGSAKWWAASRGFTLVETMVASGVFSLVTGSILVLYIFSARATNGVSRQLQLNSQARVLNFMADEIKRAQQVAVQNFNGTNFTAISPGQPQQGNALALVLPNGGGTIQVFYWLTSSGELYRATLNSTNSKMWLNNITNTVPFAMKDYMGNVVSNQMQRTLISINIFALDTNTKNYRQQLILRSAVEKRN